ncbi:MAG: hypothetical protein HFJ33_04080 [Clostridia bacterium]|nr:hypothetical protein [Clostridia bacterium]
MKTQKGVTLISLTIYIIVMTIVIATVSFISTYFYNNTRTLTKDIEPLTESTKFTSFFSEEINQSNIKILECKERYVVFDNGVQYTFVPENKGIYRNQVKVCREVESCKFERNIKNGKEVVSITVKIGNLEEKTLEYTLKN